MALKIKEIIVKAQIASSQTPEREALLPKQNEHSDGKDEARPNLSVRFLKQINSRENER